MQTNEIEINLIAPQTEDSTTSYFSKEKMTSWIYIYVWMG